MSDSTRRLDALYATLPAVECRGECQQSCGPILMSRIEWRRITGRLGDTPKGGDDLTCPMLSPEGRCSVYEIRPMICRLWGVVDRMPCPWGCQPERVLTDREGRALLSDAEVIGR